MTLDSPQGSSLVSHRLAPDGDFLAAAARHVVAFAADLAPHGDLSGCHLLLPNLKLAPALAAALREAAGGPLLLPRIDTLSGMVEPWLGEFDALPDARRQLLLHALLRQQKWFDDSLLWDVVGELVGLFDQLTEHAVALPAEESELLARLERAFELHASQALAFEARVVNTLWRAEAQGQPSRASARLLAAARWLAQLDGPLIVVAEREGDEGIEARLAAQAAMRVPVLLLRPSRALAHGDRAALLALAWPGDDAPPLRQRCVAAAPLTRPREGLRLLAADSLENLGQAVADQVLDWLRAGRRDIALVACDRLAARRARALLERERVWVQDETGWKLSTTRVAATVDAWLEVLASDAWHRALIDLLRAPLLFGDIEPWLRGVGSEAVATLIQRDGLLDGLDRMLAAVRRAAAVGSASPSALRKGEAATQLLQRLVEARAAMATQQSAGIAEWLRRLRLSLELLGAWPQFEADMAGRFWIEWLEARQAELAADGGRFSFAAWRTWFNRQMDSSLFRDERIDSPVVMTHLAATRLRRFDAAIVIGADGEHLAPAAVGGWLSHAGVRRELGLPALEVERRQLREDLAGLLLACPAATLAWQSQRRDEAQLPAPEVAVLSATLALLEGGEGVEAAAARPIAASPALSGPLGLAAPTVPPERIPERLSASAMQTLMDCPYRYFARYVLRLAEQEDLAEAMEKRDYGKQLHTILERFHRFVPQHPEDDAQRLARLQAISEDVFAEATARNFQDHAWRLRWLARLPAYLAWQRLREADGWRGVDYERGLHAEMVLEGGRHLRLEGVIDRIDHPAAAGAAGVLDYKSRGLDALKKQVRDPDDLQLAFYALLYGGPLTETAYVALDDDRIAAVAVAGDPQAHAAALADCIQGSFEAMYAGVGLPAHGTAGECAHCEMRGLCRKEWSA